MNPPFSRRACVALLFAAAACAPAKDPTSHAAPSKACAGAEHRELDFWIGEWNVTIRSRASLDSDQWAEARGTNRVASILGGCVIEETFSADGPPAPWSGRSFSQRTAADGKWHQTWVDDQGAYMTFVGEKQGADMVLTGVPRALPGGVTQQMRMVFFDIATDRLKWRWEGTRDGGNTWTIAMTIDYARTR
jgi:hypothetical protein